MYQLIWEDLVVEDKALTGIGTESFSSWVSTHITTPPGIIVPSYIEWVYEWTGATGAGVINHQCIYTDMPDYQTPTEAKTALQLLYNKLPKDSPVNTVPEEILSGASPTTGSGAVYSFVLGGTSTNPSYPLGAPRSIACRMGGTNYTAGTLNVRVRLFG
jgi:hypothetical protein